MRHIHRSGHKYPSDATLPTVGLTAAETSESSPPPCSEFDAFSAIIMYPPLTAAAVAYPLAVPEVSSNKDDTLPNSTASPTFVAVKSDMHC